MNIPDKKDNPCNRFRGIRSETEEKYRQAIKLYRSRCLSCAEICRTCKVTVSGFRRYLSLYHRHLLLARGMTSLAVRRRLTISSWDNFADNYLPPISNTRMLSRRAEVWTILNVTSRKLHAGSDWTVQTLIT